MNDTLERDRIVDNLIDRVFRLEEEVARLKESILKPEDFMAIIEEPATGGRWELYVKNMGGSVGPVLVMKEL